MTEDTRKDKRAKIVSLNVRYKSATVDEFIENHSHDVSKGGIFIKTPTPFPPGTLIKFEIRIANDKAVIMGVGRVVWKREASQSAGDRPSGMGVKFIKIDDPSRQLIDRVVAEKEGAGAAYATENEAGEAAIQGASRVPSDRPKIVSGAPGSLRPGEVRKETIMGIGTSSPPPRPDGPAPAAGGGMFPKSTSEPETGPVKEKTVMKQAAELLEEALKEAGGSMDEVGNNPLFAEGNKLEPRVGTSAEMTERSKKGTLLGMQAASPGPQLAAPAAQAKSDPPVKTPSKPTSDAPKKVSNAPPTARETPSAKVPVEEPGPTSRQRRTDPPGRKAASAMDDAMPIKKSGGGAAIWIVALLLVAGGVAYFYKDNLLGGGEQPAPTATATTPPSPAPTPTVAATATAPEPSATASAAPSASASAAPSASAVAPVPSTKPAVSAVVAPTPTFVPPPPPRPAPKPTATAAPTPAPTPTAAPRPTAAPADTTPAPAPKPKPKPKPAAPVDTSDNPY